MSKLLLYIRYDGRDFCGYQAQQNGPSVQAALNAATEDLFGHPCDVTGCSRTDSGVHARMFCVTVAKKGCPSLMTAIPPDRVPRALNVRLPDSISVLRALTVPDDFHARYAVSSKEYIYRMLCTPERDPFEVGRAWHLPHPVSEQAFTAMQTAAAHFIGKRDFSACMAAGSHVADTIRHVMDARITRRPTDSPDADGCLIEFCVRADGFLYHMVRIMVGTLADVSAGRMDPASIPARLESCDRAQMGRTAPACGLYLNRVFYDDPDIPGYHGSLTLPGMSGYVGIPPADSVSPVADGKEVPGCGS